MEDETRPIQPQSDEGKITLADLWHDIRFWHLNVVDICKLSKDDFRSSTKLITK